MEYIDFSPFLDAGKREALADYALVVAVLVMSFIASYFVRDIDSKYCKIRAVCVIVSLIFTYSTS